MRRKPRPFPLGSVSTATLRTDHLVDAFRDALVALAPLTRAERKLVREARAWLAAIEGGPYAAVSATTDEQEEQGGYILEELTAALESRAPSYCHFGTLEGDGADFGFWPAWESIEEDRKSGELPSGDQLPTHWARGCAPVGAFLVVSDHGNATLYERRAPNQPWREVWSTV